MYDMSKFKIKYFDIKLKNGKVLNLEPPKMKVLKRIANLSEIKEKQDLSTEDIINLEEAISLALSHNKQNYKISTKTIEEDFDLLEIIDFLNNYFGWINSIQNEKN